MIYDGEGYPAAPRFPQEEQGSGTSCWRATHTDMCYCWTTAGYKNLSQDFDVFLVGDATLATFPGNATPRFATNAGLCFAALDQFITQVSWVRSIVGRSQSVR